MSHSALTRRKLARAVFGTAATAALAQNPPAAPPRTPDEEINLKRERMKADIAALDREQLPIAVEPAFQFRA